MYTHVYVDNEENLFIKLSIQERRLESHIANLQRKKNTFLTQGTDSRET